MIRYLVLSTLLGALSATASAADLPRLFGATTTTKSALVLPVAAGAVRERLAAPDMALLPDLASRTHDLQDGPSFTLDLFSDVTLKAQVVRTEATASGGVAIIARIEGSPFGSAVFVQNGRVMSGSIAMPGGTYSILPAEEGTVRIAKIDPALVPPERDPIESKGAEPTAEDNAAIGDAPTDSGKLVDLIVFWTPSAQTAAGGAANIQANIDQAIALTNTSYRNSGIAQRVRLVSKQAVNYTESGADAFGVALTDITSGTVNTAGGSTVAAQRNAFGADIIVMVINDPQYCGLAWLPGTISTGNANGNSGSVVGGGSCLTSNLSFGHELGHNMGAHHDTYVLANVSTSVCPDGKEKGAFCYSRGFSHIGASSGASWRTVLAYNNNCSATVGGCTRLQYFSNPMVNYTDGFAMGDGPARNNALTLNKSVAAVSNYRATTVPIVASFADVPLADPFFGYIEFMYQGGYTGGCATGPLRYCPNDAITRGQMAVFLERTKRGANFARTPTGTIFTDVSVSTPFAGFIEQLSIDGITSGCTATTYCPTATVSRAAMAKFLLKAKCGAAYTPATPGASPFADVPVSDPFLPWINKVYTLGITTGCSTGPLNYCPNNAVTRASMATFISRTFPYGTPSDTCTP